MALGTKYVPQICVPCLRTYFHETYSCPICGSTLVDLWSYLEQFELATPLPLNEAGEMDGNESIS